MCPLLVYKMVWLKILTRPDDIITGTIITMEGEGQEARIKVAFPGLGIKELLVDLAPLEKVE